MAAGAERCRAKFLHFFPGGFTDPTYLDWERGYKWEAHERWERELGQDEFRRLLLAGEHAEIGRRAVSIESRTNLLFSFEKMAVRDAVRAPLGARAFAQGLYDLLYSAADQHARFERWCGVVASLPRKQTRVLTWPVATVWGFIAHPDREIFLKPTVTRAAAREYGYDFQYRSAPGWDTYRSLLSFAQAVRRDLADLRPRDMMDLQSFIWVQGSEEYEE